MSGNASPAEAHPGWYVVSQVKTYRVIYFTDDPDYRSPTEGDWFFVSHHRGDLPAGMTLKNCWSWRYDGQNFRDAGDPPPEDAPERLLDANRRALRTLLRELVDAARAPWAPSSSLGETLRAAKLAEARACREAGAAGLELPLLRNLAAARAITVADAATLVLDRHQATVEALVESEALRERFSHAIESALTLDELGRLRRELLAQVDGHQVAGLPPVPVPMTSAELEEPLDPASREIEVARLQAQLRYAVNRLRARIDDGYSQNDGLVKHKAKLAQAVLSNEGRPPAGLDVSMLADIADCRGLSLTDAARLVLGTVTEGENILRRTEREKDRFLARIDAARSLRDFLRVGEELRAFTHRHPDA
ncbi:MAG TPA: hypothetical protein VF457_15970 [Burkholderiaceae bacterium]